jgi:hypothetical protein
MVLMVIPIYFLFQDVFNAMLELTSKQSASLSSNIRIRAAKFFLFEFFPRPLSYFTGNGADGGKSIYAMKMIRYSVEQGFFQSDLGLIGDYTKFGVLYVLGVFIALWKSVRIKLTGETIFLRYFIYGMILLLFTGSSAFANGSNIVALSIIFYLIDANVFMNKHKDDQAILETFIE